MGTNTGKTSERLIAKALESFNGVPHVGWKRIYDSYSARSALPPQVGDFRITIPNGSCIIELKSTNHERRLLKRAFRPVQWALMVKALSVGESVVVVVHHTKTGVWRRMHFADVVKAFEKDPVSFNLEMEKSCKTFDSADEVIMDIMIETTMRKTSGI